MTTYTWNARNQLVSLGGPSVTANFQYDALGRRKSKTVNGVTTEFLYDGHTTVQELSGGSVQANLLLGVGIDEVLQRTETTSTRSLLTDGLGSTLALTDATGTVQTEYTYEPFGNTTTSGAASTNPSQYTGRENDGTGLYYYRARYYHPGLQRFISEDPIRFRGGNVNLYGYVNNSPIDLVDPSGHFAQTLVTCFTNFACVATLGMGAKILGDIIHKAVSNPFEGNPGGISTTHQPNGQPKQTRTYGPDGFPLRDYDYDHDHGQGKPHVHEWTRPEDGSDPTHKNRQKGRPPYPDENPFDPDSDVVDPDNSAPPPEENQPDPDEGQDNGQRELYE